ncbi:siderophore-interacting protein [Streptomyces laculatispora]|uniref:siderophore-interacting protein n=1 Tax=Streptomyces laculatispora TaxID=887464 RepID=UPI0035146F8B
MTAAVAAPPAAPFRFSVLTVLRTGRPGPSMLRITFGGPGLDGFAAGGRDQSLSLFLPHPGQAESVVPVDNEGNRFAARRALPADVRAVVRSYTVRARQDRARPVIEDNAPGRRTAPSPHVTPPQPAPPATAPAATGSSRCPSR